jgi:hypothetical protein
MGQNSDMALEWLLAWDAFEKGLSLDELGNRLTSEHTVETLTLMAEVDTEAAARLLTEARCRDGAARLRRLEAAIPLLESAYISRMRMFRVSRTRRVYCIRHPARAAQALTEAYRTALTAAAVYQLLGDDPESVLLRLADAAEACRLLAAQRKLIYRLAAFAFYGRPLYGLPMPLLILIVESRLSKNFNDGEPVHTGREALRFLGKLEEQAQSVAETYGRISSRLA